MPQDYTDSPEGQYEYERQQEEERKIECDWCQLVVDYRDAYGCHSVKGKQFCSKDCANSFDEERVLEKKEWQQNQLKRGLELFSILCLMNN